MYALNGDTVIVDDAFVHLLDNGVPNNHNIFKYLMVAVAKSVISSSTRDLNTTRPCATYASQK